MQNPRNSLSRGSGIASSDTPSLSECLQLEPIDWDNQKYTRLGELKRVLGVPAGSNLDEHSFGVSHSRPSPPVVAAELKHFKGSVQDDSRKARDRAKRLHESLFKLDKYRKALSSKRRQKSDLSIDDGSSGANLIKIGSQISRNPHENMDQRLEDRAKCTGLNKRVHTSMTAVRAESRSINGSRPQMTMEKSVDAPQDIKVGIARSEEKTQKLSVGGEGWDRKNKKKRSVSVMGGRTINRMRDLKQAMYPLIDSDTKFTSDTRGLRSKSSPRVGGTNKSDDSMGPTTSDTGTTARDEIESGSLPKDGMALSDRREFTKGGNKSSLDDDNSPSSPHIVIKAKVSRASRTGSLMQLDPSLKIQPSPHLQGSEQATSSSKDPSSVLMSPHKHQISAGSSSNPVTRWVGQRPHTQSRSRRASVVGPLSSNAEALDSSHNLLTSGISTGTSSIGTNGSVVSNTEKNKPKFKREHETIAYARELFESAESGDGESKSKGKGAENGEVAAEGNEELEEVPLTSRKNKLRTMEIGEGAGRQGSSKRDPSFTRPANHSVRDKLENQPAGPLIVRTSLDKSKSKTGRPPSKKLKDRKGVACVRPRSNGSLLAFTGEFNDDREELLAAANTARNTCNTSCSGPFWKKMEPMFASLSSEDASYLKQQLNFAEELDGNLSQMLDVEYNVLGIIVHKDVHSYSGEGPVGNFNQESVKAGALCGRVDIGRSDMGASLYQRLLAAFIEDDESEELFVHGDGKNLSLQYASDDSHCGSCNLIDIMESEVESQVNFQMQKGCNLDSHSCEKTVTSNTVRNPSMSSSLQSNDQWPGDDDFSHSDICHASEISSNGSIQLQNREFTVPCFPSSDRQYQLLSVDDRLLLELQSIGLYPEMLPDLAEGEELINQDITQLTKELHQQIARKKRKLGTIDKAVQKGRDLERRNVEQGAMDALLTRAYRKRMACRGGSNSKSAARKASRQAAVAFVERTLARCQQFEKTGISCFIDGPIKEVLFATPPQHSDAKSLECVASGTGSNIHNEVSNNHSSARGSGVYPHTDNLNRIKKREVLIDDVIASASSRVTSTFDSSTPSEVKGSRSSRNGYQNKFGARGSSVEIKSEHEMKPKVKRNNNPENKRAVGLISPEESDEPSIDFPELPLNELDTIGLSNDLGENQDLDSWLNIDEDGLPDTDLVGLEIPMDDLADLNMF